MESLVNLAEFYKGKRVLVTGHTGFKGSWLIFWLHRMGAKVCGYALEPASSPSLYECIGGDGLCESRIGDIADFKRLREVFDDFRPEIVINLAAQAIVREGYRAPRRQGRTSSCAIPIPSALISTSSNRCMPIC